jgi:alpha-D-xyloside xylohydrolase
MYDVRLLNSRPRFLKVIAYVCAAMMVAPVLVAGARERKVYFPLGATWTHYFTKQLYQGGTTATVPAPLENFPLFQRNAAAF